LLRVTVPAVEVKEVPELARLPETEKLAVFDMVAPDAMLRLLKARVPELVMEAPLFKVIVSEVGEKFPEEPTLSAPAILKLADVVTVAEAAIVILLIVRVPEFPDMEEPFKKVMVPVGAKVPDPLLLKYLEILKLALV
jgi:hypothetical protein